MEVWCPSEAPTRERQTPHQNTTCVQTSRSPLEALSFKLGPPSCQQYDKLFRHILGEDVYLGYFTSGTQRWKGDIPVMLCIQARSAYFCSGLLLIFSVHPPPSAQMAGVCGLRVPVGFGPYVSLARATSSHCGHNRPA